MTKRGIADSRFFGRAYIQPKFRSSFEGWLTKLQPVLDDHPNRMLPLLGNLNGRRVCEIGCGDGRFSVRMANLGADVFASDVSPEAIEIAKKHRGIDFQVMDACNLLYEHESFDLVVGFGVLHHVDLERVQKEIKRVLKPNGRAYFDEPLAHNPIANLWRKLTPSTKSDGECPLTFVEIEKMGEYIGVVKYYPYDVLTLLSSVVYLFTGSEKLKLKSSRLFTKWEKPLLKPLKRYCTSVMMEFTKRG